MIQRPHHPYAPRDPPGLTGPPPAGLTISIAEPDALGAGKLDPVTLSKVIAVLADPQTPRVTDPKTAIRGVPAVVVAARAGFKTNAAGEMKAVRYLPAPGAGGGGIRATARSA